MSKRAEKAAQKIFKPIDKGVVNLVTKRELIDFQNLRMEQKKQYIAGYEQAEKDLELAWEDIKAICDIEVSMYPHGIELYSKEYYEEVLKRFNEQKRNETH